MRKRRSDMEDNDDLYPNGYKLATYGIGRCIYAAMFQKAVQLQFASNYAHKLACYAQLIARDARVYAIAAGATPEEATHVSIEAVATAIVDGTYSRETTSTSVGGTTGVC